MNQWETSDKEQLLDFLVGDWYGENPTNKLDIIREDKCLRANYISERLGVVADSNVLEIGSGMGFTSKHVAKKVGHLHCCDISESFLNLARVECKDIPNISFYAISEPVSLPFPEDFFDFIYSDAVFIHLNLYDIFWYFSEFKRVIKKNGIVWFNIMNSSQVVMDKLVEMAAYYKKDQANLKNLLCWNSSEAVIRVASYFDFALESREMDINENLKFIKTR